MNNEKIIRSVAVKLIDEIHPTVQQLLSYRANLLSDLASDLLAAKAIDVPAGRLLRDELRAIAADIRTLAGRGTNVSSTGESLCCQRGSPTVNCRVSSKRRIY
jgi:hypothetical protein